MKAVRFHSYGGSDVLVHEDADRPVAGAGQVVVRVAGAAFNPLDVAIRMGVVQEVFPVVLPHIPAYDVAGVIVETGEGVRDWSVGDAVVAMLAPTERGAAAEYTSVPTEYLAAAPRSAELVDAAALPSTALTAWQALFVHASLEAGQRVLINGAGGAVGGYAVQLAAQAGATVTATASKRSFDRVRQHGADQIIDYTATPLPQGAAGQRFDVVLQLVRGTAVEIAPLADLVADGGTFVSTTFVSPTDIGRGARAVEMSVHPDADQLAELVTRVDAGELRIDVAERRPLPDLATIHDQAVAGQLPGKIVLTP